MKSNVQNILYRGREYPLVFNLNVMEIIQDEYGTLDRWGDLMHGEEPSAKAVKFGLGAMLNVGIDIRNEDEGTNDPMLTPKQVGRILTEYGLSGVTQLLSQTVVESTKSAEKNS
jgi:hypothetical protein